MESFLLSFDSAISLTFIITSLLLLDHLLVQLQSLPLVEYLESMRRLRFDYTFLLAFKTK
jgi:hypothetical protein